jgi:hypothetical protein
MLVRTFMQFVHAQTYFSSTHRIVVAAVILQFFEQQQQAFSDVRFRHYALFQNK